MFKRKKKKYKNPKYKFIKNFLKRKKKDKIKLMN